VANGSSSSGEANPWRRWFQWKYMTDEEIDEMTRDIYEARDRDVGRPVHLEPDVPA
jgi:hypothetical protein